jgi:hypothetical protein
VIIRPGVEAQRVVALEATRLPTKEHFARMVANGLINAKGQSTKLFGGDAEPEPGAEPPPVLTSANCNGQSSE